MNGFQLHLESAGLCSTVGTLTPTSLNKFKKIEQSECEQCVINVLQKTFAALLPRNTLVKVALQHKSASSGNSAWVSSVACPPPSSALPSSKMRKKNVAETRVEYI